MSIAAPASRWKIILAWGRNSLVLRGMAERPDSVGDLKSINVPTLIVIGEEGVLSTVADGELMRQSIAGSQLKVVPKAGHYAPWEQTEAVGTVLRQFLDDVHAR
jgi:pimeloyl-ACP methyl ester carboxylesterase